MRPSDDDAVLAELERREYRKTKLETDGHEGGGDDDPAADQSTTAKWKGQHMQLAESRPLTQLVCICIGDKCTQYGVQYESV